jgi:hypothetical protein
MASEKPPTVQVQGNLQYPTLWGDDSQLEQIFVDELLCQVVNERAYLTFGQVRLPITSEPGATVEVRPAARFILTFDALNKMLSVLNRVVGQNLTERK